MLRIHSYSPTRYYALYLDTEMATLFVWSRGSWMLKERTLKRPPLFLAGRGVDL